MADESVPSDDVEAPRALDLADFDAAVPELARVLAACVEDGAAVNFVLPFTAEEAAAYWRLTVRPAMEAGTRHVLIARMGERIAGTVQIDTATPPNQPHRGDIAKLLVHPDCRRRGLASALMRAAEEKARALGRPLLTLDTRTGDTAERLYRALGYQALGAIPGYSLHPDGRRRESATFFYKWLSDHPPAG